MGNNRWEITDGKGYKYFFESYETTTSFNGLPLLNNPVMHLNEIQPTVVNSWYLDRVEAPTGDFVNFKYTTYHPFYSSINYNEKYNYRNATGVQNIETNSSLSQTVANEIYISEIEYNNGKILINTSSREDVNNKSKYIDTSYYPQKIDDIEIYNKNGILLKCSLNYDYPNQNDPRLMLKNVQFINSENKNYLYSFLYNNNTLPSKTSNAVDHWGFYNGKGGSNIIPITFGYQSIYPTFISKEFHNNGVDREPNSECMTNYMLNTITYPTGGYSRFEYEPNTYSSFAPYFTDNYTTKRAGTNSTNENDYTYDVFTISEEQDVDLEYGFTDKNISGFQDGYESEGYCYFVSGLEGTYAQLFKIENNGTLLPIKEFIATAGVEHAEYKTEVVVDGNWIYSNSEKIHLQSGSYKILIYNIFPNNDAQSYISAKYITSRTLVNTKIGGGVRVKKIENFDGNNLQTKLYDYQINSLSSGKLFAIPSYSYTDETGIYIESSEFEKIWDPTCSCYEVELVTHNWSSYPAPVTFINSNGLKSTSYNYCGYAVGYSQVSEIINNNGEAYKNIFYYNNDWTENEFLVGQKLKNSAGDGASVIPVISNNYITYLNAPTIEPVNNGNLLKKEIYDKYGNKVLESQNYYSKSIEKDIIGLNISIPLSFTPDRNIQFYKRKCEWWKLDSIVTINHYNDKEVKIKSEYDYNPSNYLRNKETTVLSNGKIAKKQITYPCDIEDNGIYRGMSDINMIEYPIETREYVDGKLVAGELNTFNAFDNIYLPNEKYLVETNTPITSFNAFNGNKDSHYSLTPQIKFNNYRSNGRINEIINKDGTFVTYLWGYKNEYPIAEIKNATYSAVETQLGGATNVKNLAESTNPNMSTIDALRTALPNALVTTYTYKPLVGMTSMTDPRGVTTYYNYDTFNRLQWTKDANGKLIQSFDYNYKQ